MRQASPALKNVYLVHGEPEVQDAFAPKLATNGLNVSSPTPGTRVTV